MQSRRMKLLCSVLLGTAFGQYADYGAYGYAQYSAYEYDQYGNKKNKNKNQYQYAAPSGYGYDGKTYLDSDTADYKNGLHCWKCDARMSADVDIGKAAGSNVFFDCLANGGVQDCKGEERVCITETRARYDRIYAVHTGCKSPDACVANWRRNERFTLPFMLFGKHTEKGTTPQYIDDECRINPLDQQKFDTHRSQWESVCRTCCVAGTSATGTDLCNRAAKSPLSWGCSNGVTNSPSAAADACAGLEAAGSVQTLAKEKYQYQTLAAFMKTALNGLDSSGNAVAKYPMPVEGRNSVTEQKRLRKKDDDSTALLEQADLLSKETLDHFDIRAGGK